MTERFDTPGDTGNKSKTSNDTNGVENAITWGKGKPYRALTTTRLSELLFRRAPEGFIRHHSQTLLGQISAEVGNVYNSLVESGKDIIVKVFNPSESERSDRSIVITAMIDRPFIIDTLSESLRQANIHVRAILHPLLEMEDKAIYSLTYTEIERLQSPEQIAELQNQLQNTLQDLLLVTDDFQAIKLEVDATISAFRQYPDFDTDSAKQESVDFLHWLRDGGLVFLGHKTWQLDRKASARTGLTPKVELVSAGLGLFRSTNPVLNTLSKEVETDLSYVLEQKLLLHIAKVPLQSRIHRGTLIDLIMFSVPGESADKVRVHCFLGLWTSRALVQEAATIPVIRQKVEQMLDATQLLPNSHDYKEFVSIINKLPKSKLLRLDVSALQEDLDIIMRMQRHREVRLSLHLGPQHRFVSATLTMPREQLGENTRVEIQEYLELALKAPLNSSDYRLTVLDDERLIIMHFLTPLSEKTSTLPDVAVLEREVAELSLTWEDKLHRLLDESFDPNSASYLKRSYSGALPQQYQALTSPADAAFDITRLELLDESNPLEVALKPVGSGTTSAFELTIYKYKLGLTLSDIVPVLENVGFHVLDETSVSLLRSDEVSVSLYRFSVSSTAALNISAQRLNEIITPTLKRIITGNSENDALNSLLLIPGLTESQIHIIRALHCYLWQIKIVSSEAFSAAAIKDNPEVVQSIVEYFECKFNPEIFVGEFEQRQVAIEEKKQLALAKLKKVERITYDRILRALINVIDATVRTNFYVKSELPDLALKIDCSKIERMPRPRPLFEILVYSNEFEAVHLRGGKVARGGLRWSDRHEDFRTEVLGLMATQMIKNSIIVPVGAKGGFVIKPAGKTPTKEEVQNCYARFITSMLQISDNLDASKSVISPENCVVYDAADPYLVVAADKGTATFSDLANSIAVEKFNFWLGDAFASGGSCGYDHKKLGITAKGGWESVYRHFRELGIDADKQEITVCGVGDMAGDVFGNGMLQNDCLRLVGAFNHRHIFIDPNPDAKASFKERKRLFELKGSQWSDYDKALISQGGGIFDRSSKAIQISEEAQKALGISEDTLSGDALISAILRAPVDLLWNGGIGTYVKASSESDMAVDDRVNDDTRISANEVRAKVVGEGGNLGFTQLARIEYAMAGGCINTDSIDNSGGVNLSDLEVNLKILLREPVLRGELSKPERDSLILAQSSQAVDKILYRNKSLSRAISVGVRRSRKYISDYRGLLDYYERRGVFHRRTEFLPDNDTIDRREKQKLGLARPELAIVQAHLRTRIAEVVLNSEFVNEPFLQQLLISYFPTEVASRFQNDVVNHSLRKEIIATQIANLLVDTLGASFMYRTAQETGASKADIVAAFITAYEMIEARELIKQLDVLDRADSTSIYLKAFMSLGSALDAMTRWIIQHKKDNVRWSEFVLSYGKPFRLLLCKAGAFLPEAEAGYYRETCKQLVTHRLPQELAETVASFPYTAAFLDVVSIAQQLSIDVALVGKVYASLSSALQLGWLSQQANAIEPADHWERLALRRTSNELERYFQNMTLNIVKQLPQVPTEVNPAVAVAEYLTRRKESVDRFLGTIEEFRSKPLSLAALMVISGQVQSFSRQS